MAGLSQDDRYRFYHESVESGNHLMSDEIMSDLLMVTIQSDTTRSAVIFNGE